MNLRNSDLSKNREDLVLKPSIERFRVKNGKSVDKQLNKSNPQFQDSPGFASNLLAKRPSSKLGIVIRDNRKKGNPNVKCSFDGAGSATICISDNTEASELLNTQ